MPKIRILKENLIRYFLQFEKQIKRDSLLGFKRLNADQSSIAALLILAYINFINPFFGSKLYELIFGSFFNIIAYMSIFILLLNSFLERKNATKILYISINIPILFFFPKSIADLFIDIKLLIKEIIFNLNL